MRQAVLVRVGIDLSKKSGEWVAPIDPGTGKFAYVPILEDEGKKNGIKTKPIRDGEGCRITYEQFRKPCENVGGTLKPELLREGIYAHLDPDFEYITYGDEGNKAKRLRNLKLSDGDLLVFYSALRPINDNRPGHLCYAIIGFYELLKEGKDAIVIPREQWKINAHSRREPKKDDDIVFFGKKGNSGRLSKCIDIGEYHPDKGTYWTKKALCPKWGEPDPIFLLRGYLPILKDPERFYDWFREERSEHGIQLCKRNNLD